VSHVVGETAVNATDKSDEELAREAAREGSDGPAFVALLERHRQRVWQLCYRLLGNEHDAQDAAQEVFVRLFVHRDKFAHRAKFTTWLHGIVVRTCLELRRSRSRRLRRVAPMESSVLEQRPTGDTAEQAGVNLDLNQILETLDETDRALMILKYSEGYTFEELAEIFELGTSAVKMRVSRARERLQARFKEEQDLGQSG
jgi:RNA polymerase sigma-70 factor (ECF subfamily)